MKPVKELRYQPAPLSDEEMMFFNSKGKAFRELWGKKLVKGLTESEKERFEGLMLTFLREKGILE